MIQRVMGRRYRGVRGSLCACALVVGVSACSTQTTGNAFQAAAHVAKGVATVTHRPTSTPEQASASAPTDTPPPTTAPAPASVSADQQTIQQAVTTYHLAARAAYGQSHDLSQIDDTMTDTARAAILCIARDRQTSLTNTGSYFSYNVLSDTFDPIATTGSGASIVEHRHDILTIHKADGTATPEDDTYSATYTLNNSGNGWLVTDYSWNAPDGSSGSAAQDSQPCPNETQQSTASTPVPAAPTPQDTSAAQGTSTEAYQVADYNEQGIDLDVVFMGDQFAQLSLADQRSDWLLLQNCATAAGLKGTVVPVWDEGGRMGYLAPEKWQPYFDGESLSDLLAKVNEKLTCQF